MSLTFQPAVIRNYVTALLATPDGLGVYPTLCNEKVYANRILPFLDKDLPSAAVFTPQEKPDLKDQANFPGQHKMLLDLSIEVATPAKAVVADALDLCFQAILAKLATDYMATAWGGKVENVQYNGFEIERRADEKREFIIGRMWFLVTYRLTMELPDLTAMTPEHVFFGVAPNVGTGHEADYLEVTDLP